MAVRRPLVRIAGVTQQLPLGDSLPVSGGVLYPRSQLITADTVWERPTNMAGSTVWLTMIGGGESSNAGMGPTQARGGYGGQFVIGQPVDIGDMESVPCTIGAGGKQVNSGTTHKPGGPTSFGSLLTVLGGSGVTGVGTMGAYRQAHGVVATWTQTGGSTPLGEGGKVTGYTGGTTAVAGGGGGLVLDASGVRGGSNPSPHLILPAQGYGAGGNHQAGVGYAGAPGAILVEWLEYLQ